MLSLILLLGCLACIAYQDFRYRAVYWLAFPALLVLLSFNLLTATPSMQIILHAAINSGFLFLQFGLIALYFSLKEGKFVNITRGYLGWGDILLLLCLACCLPPLNFLAYYVFSLLTVLALVPLIYFISPGIFRKIPLAGLQAALFMIVLLAAKANAAFNPANDAWMLSTISRFT